HSYYIQRRSPETRRKACITSRSDTSLPRGNITNPARDLHHCERSEPHAAGVYHIAERYITLR
ncbi:MAG: hypothetical protein IJP17_07955, partial [Clostridia bacterium]|nr:hypothetical protein [Clostridia bacterium]